MCEHFTVRTTNKQTNKQNVHIIEHYRLCTVSLIKTRPKKINLSVDTTQSKFIIITIIRKASSFLFEGERKRKISALVATVNSKKRQMGVFIPFRYNSSRHLHRLRQGQMNRFPLFSLIAVGFLPKSDQVFHYPASHLTTVVEHRALKTRSTVETTDIKVSL